MSWEITVVTIITIAVFVGIVLSFIIRIVRDGEQAQIREMNAISAETLDCRSMKAKDVANILVNDMKNNTPVCSFVFVDYITQDMVDDVDDVVLDYGVAVGYGTSRVTDTTMQKSYVVRSERLHEHENVSDLMLTKRRKMIYDIKRIMDGSVAAYHASCDDKPQVKTETTVIDSKAMQYILP